jgi:hypothetical protein
MAPPIIPEFDAGVEGGSEMFKGHLLLWTEDGEVLVFFIEAAFVLVTW